MVVIALRIIIVFILSIVSFSAYSQNAKVVVIPMGADGQIIGVEIKSVPYTASASGFYYLTKNLSTSSNGIVVTANDVTIDLLGYKISGPGKLASGTHKGIDIGDSINTEIRNGTIANFPGNGISGSISSTGARLLAMRVYDNGGGGISVNGLANQVVGCTVFNNASIGISPGNAALVMNNVSYNNGSHGFYVVRSLVKNNHAYNNGGIGIGEVVAGNVIVDNYAP